MTILTPPPSARTRGLEQTPAWPRTAQGGAHGGHSRPSGSRLRKLAPARKAQGSTTKDRDRDPRRGAESEQVVFPAL